MSITVSVAFTNISGSTGGSATATAVTVDTPVTYLWADPNGLIFSNQQSVSNLFVPGRYTVTAYDNKGNPATASFCLGPVYSFGMDECQFRCWLTQMSCCAGDMIYRMNQMDNLAAGYKECVQQTILFNEMLEDIECWYQEGTMIQQGVKAMFIINVVAYTTGQTLILNLLGTEKVNYTFDTGLTLVQNLTAIIAQLTAAGMPGAYYLLNGAGTTAKLVIYAPEVGCGYNGIPLDMTTNADDVSVITTAGFIDGTDTVIATKPCLTEAQVGLTIEKLKQMARCDSPTDKSLFQQSNVFAQN